jgi:hypothetical protein
MLPRGARAQDAPAPEKLGPFEIKLAERSQLGVGLATQLRLQVTNVPGTGEAQRTTDETIEVRRLRLFLRGSFLDGRIKSLMQVGFTPGNPELLDAWGEYRAHPFSRVRVGQMKTPFTRHRAQSFTQLPLTDWDIATLALGAERQLGAMVHDGGSEDESLHYAFGIFAGPNARGAFERGVSDLYAEPLVNRSSLRTAAISVPIHPAFVAHLGYGSRKMRLDTVSDAAGGPLRAFGGVSANWDLRPEQRHDYVGRVAVESLLKWEHVGLNLVGYAGALRLTDDTTRIGLLGVTAETAYHVAQRWEISARYSRVQSSTSARADAREHAQAQLTAVSGSGLPAAQQQAMRAGLQRASDELALGLNTYVVGRSLCLQTEVAWLRDVRAGEQSALDSVRVRLQTQLGF